MSNPSDSKNIPTNKKPYKNLHTSPYKLQASDIYNPNDSPLINKPASKHNGMRLHLRSHSYGYSNDKKDFAGGGIPAPNYAHNNTPNWKTLIPPMPSYPQPTYKTDKRLYSPSQLQKNHFNLNQILKYQYMYNKHRCTATHHTHEHRSLNHSLMVITI